MKKAALYARVSTLGQGEEDKVSIPEQVQRIEKYCQEKDYTIVNRYVDVGFSGAKSKRPEFQRLLDDAKANKFDLIVCWKADRLSRGMYPAAALMEVIEPLAISIEAVEENLDMNYFAMLSVVGKMELDSIKARTQTGREGNIKRGNNHSKPPFGYDYDKATKQWVENESEASWVHQIFEWYIAGVSLYEIAKRLNNTGLPTKNRSRLGWTAQKISELVNSECYVGVAYYNKRRGATNKPKDKSQWIPMSVPAIVSQETWQAAQAKRQSNKPFSPRNTKVVYLTQHILVCEECGKSFLIHSGNGQARLVCRGMTLHPHLFNCRKPKSVKYQPIADRLWEGIKAVLESEGGLQVAIQSRVEYVTQRRKAVEGQLKELSHKLANSEDEKDIVITGFRKGFYNEDELQRQLQAIEEDRQRYKRESDSLLADMRLEGDSQAIYQHARQLIPIMQERLNSSLSDKEKQEIIKLLVRRVLLDGLGDLTIEFTLPAPDSFASVTSQHAGLPGCRQGFDDDGELANHWI